MSFSRREFLMMGALGLSAAPFASKAGDLLSGWVDPDSKLPVKEKCDYVSLATPPSLMLHGANIEFLPRLIPELKFTFKEFLTYRELGERISRCERINTVNSALLSIDDPSTRWLNPGYIEMVDQILSAGMKVTLGMVTNGERNEADPKIWEQLRKWQKTGDVELAIHTEDHFSLTQISPKQVRYQIEECHTEIKNNSGLAPVTLILPFGNGYDYNNDEIDQTIEDVCNELGITWVVGIRGGREILTKGKPYLVGRVPPSSDSRTTIKWLKKHFN